MKSYVKLNKLKGKIRERETSYRELSKITGIPVNTLSNKINGKSTFDIIQVSKICDALQIPPEQIYLFFL